MGRITTGINATSETMKRRTTLNIDSKEYLRFKTLCAGDDISASHAIRRLMRAFNDNRGRIRALFFK